MKTTGFILALVGFIGGVICVTVLVLPIGPDKDVPAIAIAPAQQVNVLIPLTICALAILVGLCMIAFGGRGYLISNNPRIRN